MLNTFPRQFHKGVIALSLFLVFTISCKNSVPTPQRWNYAINELGFWFASDVIYKYVKDTGDYQVDYFVSDGSWFATVISARKDTFGLVNSFVGKLEENQLFYVRTDSNRVLNGEFEVYYYSLVTSNSCWRLFGSTESLDENKLRLLWEKHTDFPASDGSKGELYRSLILDKI